MARVKAEFDAPGQSELRTRSAGHFPPREPPRYKWAVQLLENGPPDAPVRLLLAHGAGAAMDSDFMNAIAEGVSAHGIRVARFEFPYMAKRRQDGINRGPDRPPVLIATFKAALDSFQGEGRLFIGGKSMGGRIATMIADDVTVAGVIALGYPFHPPRRADQLRTAHLLEIRTPCLVIQGERDTFGTPQEIASYGLSHRVELQVLEDGDHSWVPRKKSGRTAQQNLAAGIDQMVAFMGKG